MKNEGEWYPVGTEVPLQSRGHCPVNRSSLHQSSEGMTLRVTLRPLRVSENLLSSVFGTVSLLQTRTGGESRRCREDVTHRTDDTDVTDSSFFNQTPVRHFPGSRDGGGFKGGPFVGHKDWNSMTPYVNRQEFFSSFTREEIFFNLILVFVFLFIFYILVRDRGTLEPETRTVSPRRTLGPSRQGYLVQSPLNSITHVCPS